MRISYRHQKKAQPEGQHDDIQHGVLLLALVSGRDRCAFREGGLRRIKNKKLGLQEVVWVFLATSEGWKHACEHLEPQIFLVA